MILKKIMQKKENKNYENMSEEELMAQWDKRVKKSSRFASVKSSLLYLLVFIGLIGGYKSLFSSNTTAVYDEQEVMHFAQDYATKYYTYPRSEENDEYLKTYTVSDEWGISVSTEMEYMNLEDTSIYKVKLSNVKQNIYEFYMRGTFVSKKRGSEEQRTPMNLKVSMIKSDGELSIVRPIESTFTEIPGLKDKEKMKKYLFEPEKGKKQCTEEQIEQVKMNLELFCATYHVSIEQAKLLVADGVDLDGMDSNVVLTVQNLISTTQDDTNYYVSASIKEEYSSLFTQLRKYYFVIDKTNNKIQQLEVY